MLRGKWLFLLSALGWWAGGASAQEVVRLQEAFPVGYAYEVSSRVELSGNLTVPADGKEPARSLTVQGKSALDYQERVLQSTAGQVVRTLRWYRRLEFQRQVGAQQEQLALRPEVRRLVILRRQHLEVPFSPDGPLTWNEIDFIRTDVFTPALTGLLPAQAVAVGARWPAQAAAVQELTDLNRLESGQVECELAEVVSLSGRRLARVNFRGRVRGLGEDGPTQHELDGYLFFDLSGQFLSYLSLRGTQALLGAGDKVLGQVSGQLVLSRRPAAPVAELSDAALRGLSLEPTADNTLLLYEEPLLGVRFEYPRHWRIVRVQGRQLVLENQRGSGLLLTVEPLSRLPGGAQFLQEARTYLEQQRAQLLRVESPQVVHTGSPTVEHFAFVIAQQGQQAYLDYYVVRDQQAGATVAARFPLAEAQAAAAEVRRLVLSLRWQRKREP